MVKLDLSKFKHVSSDDKSTRLKHEDGHFLVLAHKALNKNSKAQLSALSKIPAEAQTATQSNEADNRMPMADGGEADSKDKGILNTIADTAKKVMTPGTVEQETEKPDTPSGKYYYTSDVKYKDGGPVKGTLVGDKVREIGDQINKALHTGEITQEGQKPPEQPEVEVNKDMRRGLTTPKENQEYAKGGEVCHACGGKVHPKMYANPTEQVSQDDSAPDMTAQVVPNYKDPMQTPVPKEVQKTMPKQITDEDRLKQIYQDKMMGMNAGSPYLAGKGILPGDNDQAFGPNGEPPKEVNSDVLQKSQIALSQEQSQNAAQAASTQQSIIAQNQARSQFGLPPLPVPDIPNGPQVPGSDLSPVPNTITGKPESSSPVQPDDISKGMTDAYGMMQKGYDKRLTGIKEQAEAQGAQGLAEANILQQAQKSQTDAKAAYQQHFNELNQERQAHIADIQNGYIDPNKYWTGDSQGNGGHSRVATAIGMILAGFNPTNRPNAAIELLKHQMEMNIDAQKQNLGAKQNLLTANLAQFHNIKDATDMTRMMQSDIVSNQLLQAAATAKTPMAAAAAKQAAGQLQMDMAPKFQEFAMRRAMMGLANGNNPDAAQHVLGYMRMFNPEVAKEMESRLVPGTGMASVPVPPAVRDEIVAHQKLQQIGQDTLDYARTHTNIVPGTPEYNIGVQKAMILQQAIREGLLGTVFRESEKPLLSKFVDDNPAGAFKTLSAEPKIRTILESNVMQLNTLKKNYGLPTQEQQSSSQPQYKTVNGVKYMRGPKGEAVRVK